MFKKLFTSIRETFGPVLTTRKLNTEIPSHWPTKPSVASAPSNALTQNTEPGIFPGDLMAPPEDVLCDATYPQLYDAEMNQSLIMLSPYKADHLAARDAFEGTLVLGATGSGKTSGSGRLIATAYLRAGWGGLICCAKEDEPDLWIKYCKETGRTKDLIIFDKESKFNFLQYELDFQVSTGVIQIPDLVSTLMTLVEIKQRKGGTGKGDDFWSDSAKQLLGHAMTVLVMATGKITMMDIRDMILDCAKSVADTEKPAWREKSKCWEFLQAAAKSCTDDKKVDLQLASKYFLKEWPELNDRTRSSIEATLSTTLDEMYRSPVRQMFTEGTTISPDSIVQEGKIIVVSLSYDKFLTLGQYANVLWKLAVQRACKRNLKRKCPTFIWADECQYFITKGDQLFQTTARSSRCAVVYLTQSIPNLHAELGGDNAGKSAVESLLGNLQTRFFHLNSESQTNKWASDTIGQDIIELHSGGTSSSMSTQLRDPIAGISGSMTSSENYSQQINHTLFPVRFTELLNGSSRNKQIVTGYCHRVGRQWHTGNRYLLCYFPQADPPVTDPNTRYVTVARDSSLLNKMADAGL